MHPYLRKLLAFAMLALFTYATFALYQGLNQELKEAGEPKKSETSH